MLHNALHQIHIELEKETISGFSISGLSTYLQIPELDLCFDIGECPLSAIPLNHIFLTHAHGDHSRCLMRHHSLRFMMNLNKSAVYFMPDEIVQNAKNWIRAEAIFENVHPRRVEYPNIIGLQADAEAIPLPFRKDLRVKAFSVRHGVPSLGYTIYDFRKKLKTEFIGLESHQIVELKNRGIPIVNESLVPRVTFIGDCLGRSLLEQKHIWDSNTLILECTFIEDDEKEMAIKKGHTHISEIVKVLQELGSEIKSQTILLKHFSMKYPRRRIIDKVKKEIPEEFRDRIKLLL